MTVTAEDERFDHQFNVYWQEPDLPSLQVQLEYVEAKQKTFEEQNERLRGEETSIDHALAALLARDATKFTPFRAGGGPCSAFVSCA